MEVSGARSVRCTDGLGCRAQALRKDRDRYLPRWREAAPVCLNAFYFVKSLCCEVALTAVRTREHRNVFDNEKGSGATVATRYMAQHYARLATEWAELIRHRR